MVNLVQNSHSELKCNDFLDDPPNNAVIFCLDYKEFVSRSDYESHNRAMLRGKKHSQVRLQDGVECIGRFNIKPIFMCNLYNSECICLYKADEQYICRKCLKKSIKTITCEICNDAIRSCFSHKLFFN